MAPRRTFQLSQFCLAPGNQFKQEQERRRSSRRAALAKYVPRMKF